MTAVTDLDDLEAENRQMTLWVTEEAIQRAGEHAHPEWLAEARDAVYIVALRKPQFTTDDVWDAMAEVKVTTHEPRAIGAVMRSAAKEGICAPTLTYLNSRRRACHLRPLRVWKSLIYG